MSMWMAAIGIHENSCLLELEPVDGYICLLCLQREACLRSAACFSVLLQHECVLRHDTLQCCSATSGSPFGCSRLLIWCLVSFVVDTWCFAVLRCLALCWHVLAGMLDMRVSRPACRGCAYAWIVEANQQRHQWTSALTVNGFTVWCLNSLHKHWHHRTCRSFVFSRH